MPELSGYEAVSEIKQNRELKEIPIIFISGRIDKGQAHELLKPSDPVTFIEHPVNHEDLKETIENFLNKT